MRGEFGKALRGVAVLMGLCAVSEPTQAEVSEDFASGACSGVIIDTRVAAVGHSADPVVMETRVCASETVSPIRIKTLPHPGSIIIIR